MKSFGSKFYMQRDIKMDIGLLNYRPLISIGLHGPKLHIT